ncbi:MAG: hypothetical protein RLZZ316_201 [Bacteroidota bacterium]|jgi:hypothetical protein
MKKFTLIVLLATVAVTAFAQKVDKAKDYVTKNKFAEAKNEIEAVLADPKNQKNAEAWYIKCKAYNGIAADAGLSAQTPDARWTAFEALKKYIELDDKAGILLQFDKYQPVMDIYQGYYRIGAAQFNEQKNPEALANFKSCLTVGEFMAKQGWTNVKMDTTVVLYAGIVAERAKNKDEAAFYYGKLAEAKVNSKEYIDIYKWLADFYYQDKKDVTNSQKFLGLGKEVFPEDPFWATYELEMLRDGGDKKALFAKYEEVIAQNPTNHENIFNYGVEMYQEAYKPEIKERPTNSVEIIAKVEAQMKKVIELKPEYVSAYLVLGQISYNRGIDVTNVNKTIRPPAGGKLKPEELKKKEELRAEAGKHFDAAIPHFEKIDALIGSKGKLTGTEKQNLKEAYDLLTTIYDVRGNKEKMKIYEEKFINVDKQH